MSQRQPPHREPSKTGERRRLAQDGSHNHASSDEQDAPRPHRSRNPDRRSRGDIGERDSRYGDPFPSLDNPYILPPPETDQFPSSSHPPYSSRGRPARKDSAVQTSRHGTPTPGMIALTNRTLWQHLRSRKLLLVFILVLVTLCLFLGTDPRGADSMKAQRCAYLPWLAQCKSVDHFASLQYDTSAGYLVYPARSLVDVATKLPPQPHPIHLLITKGEAAWAAKKAAQTTTLHGAVAEYRRRYNMAPPKGFGEWWAYANSSGVQLMDEYDSIYNKFLPFASLPRDVLQDRSDRLQNDEDLWLRGMAFTVQVRDQGRDIVAVGPMAGTGPRAGQVVDMFKGFGHYLPDLNITITTHDVPWVVIAGEARDRHIAAAKEGKYIDPADYENYTENGALDGWTLICGPNTTIRSEGYFDERKEVPLPPTTEFIYDHIAAMDLCEHPERQAIHGFTAWPGPRPGLLFPMFTFTMSTFHQDIGIPPLEQYDREVGDDPLWQDKKINKILWRGSTTGSDLTIPHMRKYSQRARLARLHKQTGSVTIPLALSDTADSPGPVTEYRAHAFDLSEEYFDFQFMGHAQQCGDEAMCKKFEQEFTWVDFMSVADQNQYKYHLDVDGNGWSGRFHRLMSSNSLVLKSTIFPEWYQERIQPWVHYVPIAVDYRDLWSVMGFFKGDDEGRGSHEHLAEKMATQGKEWSGEYWRFVDMQAYFFRQLLEYNRVMNRDPDNPTNMDYVEPSSTPASSAAPAASSSSRATSSSRSQASRSV